MAIADGAESKCGGPRVSKGGRLKLNVSPYLTVGPLHTIRDLEGFCFHSHKTR